MRFALQLAVFLTLAFFANAATPAWVQLAQLTASDGQQFDALGSSVSISGNTIVAGAPKVGVYVFIKPQSGWTNMTQVAKLTASDGQSQDFFGYPVSISGDTIVVGAPCATINGNSCQGAAYVFVKPVSGWANMTETAKLTTSDGQAGDAVASSTSISGNTIALGAPRKTVNGFTNAGEVYVYQRPSSGWTNMTETAKFTESSGNRHGQNNEQGSSFGESVAVGGGTLVVGAPDFKVGFHNYGDFLVFVKAASGWKHTTRTARLQSSKNSLSDLGTAVAISSDGGTVVGGTNLSPNPGRTLIFVKPANGWQAGITTETAVLTDGTGTQDEFGSAVGISGNTIIVGAWNPRKLGAAYVFAKPANGWKTTHKYQAKLMATDEDASWNFGGSVAISGSTSVVGANGWSNALGAAFVFGK
jgi:hypothetical protein